MTEQTRTGPWTGVAVLIPCHNEELAVGRVIADFQASLPGARIIVCDNASTDRTAEVASAAGAEVVTEPLPGKGNAVRRLFADVSADVFVLVDGDATYDAASAPGMIERLHADHLDMIVGTRVETAQAAYRPGHRFGNRLLTGMVAWMFGPRFRDMLSGYRVFSRRFVKTFPSLSEGFEIETELAVHALEIRAPVAEVPTPYSERPPGSASKLNTVRDGLRIMRLIAKLVREERPLQFFGGLALAFLALSLALGVPVVLAYFDTGSVPRMPTWILAVALLILAFLSGTVGVILDVVTRARRELKRLAYLAIGR